MHYYAYWEFHEYEHMMCKEYIELSEGSLMHARFNALCISCIIHMFHDAFEISCELSMTGFI